MRGHHVDAWHGHYVLGFALALNVLRSQTVCGLFKNPSDETKPRNPVYVRVTECIVYMFRAMTL